MFDADTTPDWLDDELWQDYLEWREKELKVPLGRIGRKRALMKLYRMKEAGEDIEQVIERSMVAGWKGLFPTPPELRESRAQAHQDAKKPDLPEYDPEKAAENVRYLNDALNGTMKITGGGR